MTQAYTLAQVEELVERAQKGDTTAFGELFTLLSDEIYRYCTLQNLSNSDAQDILSETFKKAWSYIYRYKKNNFRAFLYSIARNLIFDYFADQKKRGGVNYEEYMVNEQQDDTVLEKVEKEDESSQLLRVIARLPNDYKEVVTLRYIQDLSIQETAHIMNKSPESIRVTQHRAIQKLKQILGHGR